MKISWQIGGETMITFDNTETLHVVEVVQFIIEMYAGIADTSSVEAVLAKMRAGIGEEEKTVKTIN